MTGSGRSPDDNRPLLLRHGRIIDPASRFDEPADLLIEDGVIAAIGTAIAVEEPGLEVIDVAGLVVSPGFVDLHTHLRFPGFPEKETIASGTAAAAAGGFTTICAMANTNPAVDRVEILRQVRDEASRSGQVRVRQLAAVTRGLEGREMTDFRALAAAGAVAFSDDGKPVWNPAIMRKALQRSDDLGLPISVHEEDPIIVGRGVANAGAPARAAGLAEWPCSGEVSLVARDIQMLREVGGHLHIAHVSCRETAALVRAAKAEGLRVTAEVTPHHLRLTDGLLAGDPALGLDPGHPCTKVNPPLRAPEDAAALIAALADGAIDAVATDHAPHTAADKAGPYDRAAFGISAIETALPLLLDLVRAGQLDMTTLISRLTVGPARTFGLEGGTLRPGAPADVCVFDPGAEWTVVPEALHSQGKNTPILGATLRGRVVLTLVGGTFAYRQQ